MAQPKQTYDLAFDAASHTYTIDRVPVPSVTQTLSPLYDLSSIPPAVLERKRRIGTAVHRACELFELGKLNINRLHPDVFPYFSAYTRFLRDTGWRSIFLEQQVFHIPRRFAGTLDRGGYFQKQAIQYPGDCILDLKVTWDISPVAKIQVAAYEAALLEQMGIEVQQLLVLQLKRDGTYTLVNAKQPGAINVFYALLLARRWQEANGCLTTKRQGVAK